MKADVIHDYQKMPEEEARNSLKKIKNVISDVDYKKALSKLGGE